MEKNTFGDYKFDNWVPENVREMIIKFWGCFGRTHEDWLKSSKEQSERETCYHIFPRGFGMPPYGAKCIFFIKNWELIKQCKKEIYETVEGRYIHRWNNMGSVIDKHGVAHCVSTCEMWVRVFDDENKITKLLDN